MASRRRGPALEAALNDLAELSRLEAVVDALDSGAAPTGAIVQPARESKAGERHVAIVPGSFNPLTLAHVALARSALSAGADEVYLTLSRHTIDKSAVTRPTLADRALLLATYGRGTERVGCALFNRGLYADQAQAARELFPSAARITFVVGFDKAEQIFDPRYYANRDATLDALFAVAEILVAPRGVRGVEVLNALVDLDENQRFAHRVHALPLDPAYAHDSATRVRALASASLPIDALVPDVTMALVALANPYLTPRLAPDGQPLDAYGQRQARIRAYQLACKEA